MDHSLTTVPAEAVGSAPPARRRSRLWLPLSPAEWALVAYLLAVIGVTVASWSVGKSIVHLFATTPDDLSLSSTWQLLTSALLADGPLAPQVLGTAILGICAIRLSSGRTFWTAALLAHVLGTVVVYVGVWIAGVASPSGVAALAREADFGVSLVWCAALGVLAAVAWWRLRPLKPSTRLLLAAGAPLALVAVTVLSDGLGRYEHVVAFALAVATVYMSRRRRPFRGRLRASASAGDDGR